MRELRHGRYPMRYIVSLLLVLSFALTTVSGAMAQGVTSAFSYQGKLTDARGRYVEDGDYEVTFKIYGVESGTDAPLWTSQVTRVATTQGLFSTVVSPPSSVFNNTSLWLETVVGTTAMVPRAKLQSAPFAVHAGLADTATIANTVPNGAITADKLGSDVDFMRAPYLAGIESGLPTTYTLCFYIDGVAVANSPTLAEPYREEYELVWYQDGEDPVQRVRPGRSKSSRVTIRRKFTSDRTLFDWAKTVQDGRVVRHTFAMAIMSGTTRLARWTFANAWPSHYNIRLTDDGLPVEEVTIACEGVVAREANMDKSPKPTGSGTQLGFGAMQMLTTSYRLAIPSITYPEDMAIASDTGFGSESIEYLDENQIVRKRPGRTTMDGLKVRQNPSSRSSMYSWYQSTATAVSRRDVTLYLSSKGGTNPLVTYKEAWPYAYTLRLADDNQPIEEFDITYEQMSAPTGP